MCKNNVWSNPRLGLGFDLWPLTSGSVHAEVLPWTICLPTLVLIAWAVFLLERGQTDKQTDSTERPTPRRAIQPAWVNIARYANVITSNNCAFDLENSCFTSCRKKIKWKNRLIHVHWKYLCVCVCYFVITIWYASL